MLYVLQKHRVKLEREVEDLKTLAQRGIRAQHGADAQWATLAQGKEVTWRSLIHEGASSASRALSA